MLVHFRSRINVDLVNKVNKRMVLKMEEMTSFQQESAASKIDIEDVKKGYSEEIENNGKLILDASFTPGDISYPRDIELLNQARKQIEIIIYRLYKQLKGRVKNKPRTYRQVARKNI